MNTKEQIFYWLAKHCKKQRFQRFFEKKLAKAGGGGYGGFAYSEAIRQFYKDVHGVEIGYGCFGECWCNSAFWWKGIKIGRYCSFAQHTYIATANHPMDTFTTHPVAYCMEYGALDAEHDIVSHGLTIGNGVWIGQNVLIMPGCYKIGDGAIVGAGSVVTHDVPPYAIVAGSPAKILRYRFSPEVIKKIEDTKWWTFDKDYVAIHTKEWNKLVQNK